MSSGNIYAVAQRSLPPDKKVSEWMKNTEVLQAAKAVIRADVAVGAKGTVPAAPAVIISKSGKAQSPVLISGISEVQRYVNAIKGAL